jgi:hypothetical protein
LNVPLPVPTTWATNREGQGVADMQFGTNILASLHCTENDSQPLIPIRDAPEASVLERF